MRQTFAQFLKESEEFNTETVLGILYDSDYCFEDVAGFETTIVEKSVVVQRTPQKWGLPKGGTDEEKRKSLMDIYQTALELAVAGSKKLASMLKTSARRVKDPKVLVDIKKEESFLNKVILRGKVANEITDVLRSAVIVKTDADVDVIVKQIKKDFKVVEHEYKAKGSEKEFGYYGSHHFLVVVNDITAEIQVMTRRLWAYKIEAHKIYAKYREPTDFSKEVIAIGKRLSKEIFDRGNN